MRSSRVVDLDTDPGATRLLRRSLLLRYGLVVGSVLLIAGGVVGTTLLTRKMNERDVVELSNEFIRILDDRIVAEVESYLSTARDSVHNLSVALSSRPLSAEGQAAFETMAGDILARQPQISAVYLGTSAGSFLLLRRNESGTLDRKTIIVEGEDRHVTWYRRDESGNTVSIETDPEDPYDPRTRGWFAGAANAEGVYWSDVYIFFTDKIPGLTAAKAAPRAAGDDSIVVGADIYLDSLGAFLKSLQEAARGKLAIVADNGDFVAYSEIRDIIAREGENLRPVNIHEIDEPALAEAFERVRVGGYSQSHVEIDGTLYLLAATSLRDLLGKDWSLVLLAPESAYTGFLVTNNRHGFAALAVVMVLAMLLGGYLAYQGYQVDRGLKRLRGRQEELARQAVALQEFTGLSDMIGIADEGALHRAMELMTQVSEARRASLWRLSPDNRDLVCVESYDSDGRGHTDGIVLRGGDFPALFEEMARGGEIHLEDPDDDVRVAGLKDSYMRTLGLNRLVSVPAEADGRVLGALWLEYDRQAGWSDSARAFAYALARMACSALKAGGAERLAAHRSATAARPASAAPAETFAMRAASLSDTRAAIALGGQAANGESGAGRFDRVTVLVLQLRDDDSLARSLGGSAGGSVLERIVDAAQDEADKAGILYLKVLSDQLVAIDGFDGDAEGAAHRLMHLALHLQSCCSDLFLQLGHGAQYSLGLDTGPCMGAHVGFERSRYNVWGEAVQVASSLARSAQPGSIQVSETAYEHLREQYIFRPRGHYYLEQAGEMTTFILRGHL